MLLTQVRVVVWSVFLSVCYFLFYLFISFCFFYSYNTHHSLTSKSETKLFMDVHLWIVALFWNINCWVQKLVQVQSLDVFLNSMLLLIYLYHFSYPFQLIFYFLVPTCRFSLPLVPLILYPCSFRNSASLFVIYFSVGTVHYYG